MDKTRDFLSFFHRSYPSDEHQANQWLRLNVRKKTHRTKQPSEPAVAIEAIAMLLQNHGKCRLTLPVAQIRAKDVLNC
jgi:hypothetical protein